MNRGPLTLYEIKTGVFPRYSKGRDDGKVVNEQSRLFLCRHRESVCVRVWVGQNIVMVSVWVICKKFLTK